MNDKTFFDTISEKRETIFAELDNNTFGPKIRNHLVQLFRNARAVDPGLTGLIVGMGGCNAKGTYLRFTAKSLVGDVYVPITSILEAGTPIDDEGNDMELVDDVLYEGTHVSGKMIFVPTR